MAIIESLRINVTGSEFESNELGIDLYDSENVTVEESTIVDTERVGLVLERADYNDFRGVTIEGTTADDALDGVSAGIFLDNATKNDFSELEVSDNENWAVFAIRDGTNDFDNSVFGTTQFSFRIRNVAFDAGGAESAEEDDPVEEFVPLDVAATQADSILNVTLREPVGEANETTAPGETETGDGEEETSDGETSDEETSDGDDETTAEDDSADEDEDTADAETEAEEETETEAALSIEMETPIAPVAKTAATTATEIPTIRG